MKGGPILPRDAAPTGFTATLEALLREVPEALCATLLDAEGETIDLATRIDAFDARVYSAEFALPLATLRTALRHLEAGPLRELRLTGDRRAAVLRQVSDGCDVLVVVEGSVVLPFAARAVARASVFLAEETGMPSRRPISLRPEAMPGDAPEAFLEDGRARRIVEVLGAYEATMLESLLVRTAEGDECVIARDPTTGRWFRI